MENLSKALTYLNRPSHARDSRLAWLRLLTLEAREVLVESRLAAYHHQNVVTAETVPVALGLAEQAWAQAPETWS